VNPDQGNSSPVGTQGAVLDPTMSLVGRLEDLSLGEILQIVSLSNRSGLLRIESPGDRASIYVRAGKVVYAARSDEKEGLLSHLMHHGLVEKDQIESLRKELEDLPSNQKVKDFLHQRLGITSEAFLKVLKNRVEELVYSLFHWEEGTFSFQLIDEEKHKPLLEKVAPFFLEQGIGCQFLVMEGARRRDEMVRQKAPDEEAPAMEFPGEMSEEKTSEDDIDGEEVFEEGFEEETSPLMQELEGFEIPKVFPPFEGAPHGTVVIIGLEREIAEGMADALRGKGVTPLLHDDGADGLGRIQELREKRILPLLILDIEASGITDGRKLGGLEILSTIWDLGFCLPVGLVHRGDLPEGLREKLEEIPGLKVLPLPDTGEGEEVTRSLVETALRGVPGEETPASGEMNVPEKDAREDSPEAAPEASEGDADGSPPLETPKDMSPGYYDIQGELVEELNGIDLPFEGWEEEEPEIPTDQPVDPHMSELSSYVQELNRQDISGEVTLLALRFASLFMSRAILFLVRKEDFKGLGQFGVDLGEGKDPDAVVRSLVLPLGSSEIFHRVLVKHQSYKGPSPGSETERLLFEALGGETPAEIYVGPIISMGRVAVLLYGDNIPGDQVIEPTHTLDIFLSHVGLALDRAFLEMKLKTRRS